MPNEHNAEYRIRYQTAPPVAKQQLEVNDIAILDMRLLWVVGRRRPIL
jgi:hypothetical protein